MKSNFPLLSFPRYSKVNQNIHSRFGKLQIDEITINQVIGEFDLEVTGKPSNLPYGKRGRNVVVPTSKGKKVIRRYRKKWKSPIINYEHSILSELEERNFLAPRINRTSNGRGIITIRDENYALFDFIIGRNFSLSYMFHSQRNSLVEKAAMMLADLHDCLRGFEPGGQHHLGFKSSDGLRHRDLDWNCMKLDYLVQSSSENSDSQDKEALQQLVGISEEVRTSLVELDVALLDLELPRTVIHGDYGLHNILVNDSGEIIPMDFELARLEWRLCDFVISFLRIRNKKRQYDFEWIKQFIWAYQLRNPISASEWELFPKVWQHTLLYAFIQYWNSYFESNRNSARLTLAVDAYHQFLWAKTNNSELIQLAQFN